MMNTFYNWQENKDEMFQNISLVIYDHFEQHCEMVSFDIKYMVLGCKKGSV